MPMQSEGLGMAHGADGGALQPPCVCVTVFLAWIRSRPNELWRFDDLVSHLSFFLPILGFEKQAKPARARILS